MPKNRIKSFYRHGYPASQKLGVIKRRESQVLVAVIGHAAENPPHKIRADVSGALPLLLPT
jgi:hypothetical protein